MLKTFWLVCGMRRIVKRGVVHRSDEITGAVKHLGFVFLTELATDRVKVCLLDEKVSSLPCEC